MFPAALSPEVPADTEGAKFQRLCGTRVGILQDALPHVFERFYRGAPPSLRAAGAGLGLAIAHWIAAVHTATIAVASASGKRTWVTRFPDVA